MSLPFRIAKKTTWGILLTVATVGAFVVYAATVDRTIYTTETLVVIPQTVVSDSWVGTDQVLIQDLSDDALFQDFDLQNAASLNLNASQNESGPITETVTESDSEGNLGEPVSENIKTNPPAENTELPVANEEVEPETNPEAEIEEETVVQPELESQSIPEPEVDLEEPLPVSWGVFPYTNTSYPLTQLSESEALGENVENSDGTVITVNEPIESIDGESNTEEETIETELLDEATENEQNPLLEVTTDSEVQDELVPSEQRPA